jgi:hypothetical protein
VVNIGDCHKELGDWTSVEYQLRYDCLPADWAEVDPVFGALDFSGIVSSHHTNKPAKNLEAYHLVIKKMQIRTIERLELPPTADMHVHLRQAGLMEVVVPTVRKGGVDTVFVYGGFLSKILKRNERTDQGA